MTGDVSFSGEEGHSHCTNQTKKDPGEHECDNRRFLFKVQMHKGKELHKHLDCRQTQNYRDDPLLGYDVHNHSGEGKTCQYKHQPERDNIFHPTNLLLSLRLALLCLGFHDLTHLPHEVDNGEDKHPHHVDKVPVETGHKEFGGHYLG